MKSLHAKQQLASQLKRLEKSLQEIETAGDSYTALTSKLTGGKEKAQVDLNDKKYDKLIRTYREAKWLLNKVDRSFGLCLDVINELDRSKRIKRGEKEEVEKESNIIQNGKQVAAHIPQDEGESQWILCTVVGYDEYSQRYSILIPFPVPTSFFQYWYEVEDEDPEDPDKSRHMVTMEEVIPLPEEKKDLPIGTQVLAMFPNTTSFYTAAISSPPKYGRTSENHYWVKFADDEDETGETPIRQIPARHVLFK